MCSVVNMWHPVHLLDPVGRKKDIAVWFTWFNPCYHFYQNQIYSRLSCSFAQMDCCSLIILCRILLHWPHWITQEVGLFSSSSPICAKTVTRWDENSAVNDSHRRQSFHVELFRNPAVLYLPLKQERRECLQKTNRPPFQNKTPFHHNFTCVSCSFQLHRRSVLQRRKKHKWASSFVGDVGTHALRGTACAAVHCCVQPSVCCGHSQATTCGLRGFVKTPP